MPKSTALPSAHSPSPAAAYEVELADLHAHLYRVTLAVARPARRQRMSLPVWIPGSYLVREFAKHLQGLQARQAGQPVAVKQLDKCTWEVDCKTGAPLELRYQVYAFDASVRAAWLDSQRGFFNGTSLCLRVHGQEHLPHELTLKSTSPSATWSVATGLAPLKINRRGFGRYRAANYDELVDCPVTLGPFWSGQFKAFGLPHRLVVSGSAPGFDGARLLADCRKICETQLQFWHGQVPQAAALSPESPPPPFAHYVFMLHAAADDYGGLEHRNSTALICKRADLPQRSPDGTPAAQRQPEGYTTLLGLISHEYFHTWNVKQIRPSAFLQYDYTQENYTDLLWFFEGFTSYYDDLLLRRAGLIDDATYLRLLTKNINQLQQTPGRLVQTVAQASFDAWVKYYRPDENTPNATVSYYGKGALVALCLDLTLRAEGRTSLDEVMRQLWRQLWRQWSAVLPAPGQGKPPRRTPIPAPVARPGFTEASFLAVLKACAGRSLAAEINRWVHSTEELPLAPLLTRCGVAVSTDAAPLAQALGLRVATGLEGQGGVRIKTVLHGGAAHAAGLAAGDEWLGIWSDSPQPQGWRMSQLDDLLLYAGPAQAVTVLVARDKQLLTLPLEIPRRTGPGAITTWRLTPHDTALLAQWLA
ncbi:MAG: M61 family metallopeptidase [Burkholderiaceae bacterium]